MELDRIRAWQLFIETSRLGSLALAAEALSFPLPKASRLISSLEDELGFQLLDRTKKPAVLTAEGQALVLDTQGLISQWGILREKADALRKGNFDLSRRSLRISLPVNMDRSVFFEALQNLPIKHPGLQLEFCADVGQQALLEGGAYTPDTPAAVVYKATWPEEKTVRCTVGTLAESVHAAGITKTALIVAGGFLGRNYERSKLYDPAFTTEFRKGTDQ